MIIKKPHTLNRVTTVVVVIALAVCLLPINVSAAGPAKNKPSVATAASGGVDQPCSLHASGNFLTFPTWYKYIKTGKTDANGNCTVPDLQLITKSGAFNGTGILLVLLAIIDILLRLVGLVALAFVVYGGIRYTTSQGSPDSVQQAQSTLTNAIIGLLIAVIAVGVVSFIGHRIG